MTCPRCGSTHCVLFAAEQAEAGIAGWVAGYTAEIPDLSCDEIASAYVRVCERAARTARAKLDGEAIPAIPINASLFAKMAGLR